jgi:hypothetical protein
MPTRFASEEELIEITINPAQPCQQSAHDIDRNFSLWPPEPQPAERLVRCAGGEQVAPECRGTNDPRGHGHHNDYNECLEWDAEGSTKPDVLEIGVPEGLDRAVRENLCDAAASYEENKRRDDGLDPKDGDKHAR